jgi:hypothetical protein
MLGRPRVHHRGGARAAARIAVSMPGVRGLAANLRYVWASSGTAWRLVLVLLALIFWPLAFIGFLVAIVHDALVAVDGRDRVPEVARWIIAAVIVIAALALLPSPTRWFGAGEDPGAGARPAPATAYHQR